MNVPMKRLLSIGHSYVVGANRRLADEMARQGAGRWQVTAAAPAHYPGDLRDISLEPIENEACRVVPLSTRFARSPHLMLYGGLGPLLAEGWDVVHCWEEPYVASATQVARLMPPGASLVVATFQNLSKLYPPPFNWMERRVLRRADGWIAFGNTVHEVHRRRSGYTNIPSEVIPPGVDIGSFAPASGERTRIRAARGWDEDVPVVGFAGRFVPEKGLAVLAEALSRLTRPWRALFVGGGPDVQRLHELAAAFPGRVSIATGITHSEMPAYFNAMDVLCAPSQTTARWREQFGRMLIEAMACGVPVIGSDSGEIPHVLGDAGILVSERDVPAWTAALDRLLANDTMRRDLGERGLRRARADFSWDVVARRHLTFFEELAARS